MRVKEILKEKGMLSKDLAEKMGMTETGLSIMLGENGNPSLQKLQKLAKILDVPVADLFDRADQPSFTCPNCGARIFVSKK